MDKYNVKLLSKAYDNLDEIYMYISNDLMSKQSAEKLIDKLEAAILSLEDMPKRGVVRKTGVFGNKGYRQIFVNNFTIIYRINEINKEVVIVSVRY